MIPFLKALFLPPASLVWLAAAGLILLRTRWRRAGAWLAAGAVGLLYLLSTPLLVGALLQTLDRYPPLDLAAIEPGDSEAIVILSAGRREAPEYGGESAGPVAFERLRYGVWLHRRLDRPILITGRNGDVMARAMEDSLGTSARWLESGSANTHLHVVHSAPLLAEAGIERIYLVTHYWHMPRAMAAFARAGVEVVPAPMGFAAESRSWYDPRWILPGLGALCTSSLIFHEWIGRLWYRLLYGY